MYRCVCCGFDKSLNCHVDRVRTVFRRPKPDLTKSGFTRAMCAHKLLNSSVKDVSIIPDSAKNAGDTHRERDLSPLPLHVKGFVEGVSRNIAPDY